MSRELLRPVGDFQPYLDAVIKSGERTRGVIYVTLLILFFIACGIRNEVYPAWDALRLERMQLLHHCFVASKTSDECKPLELYEQQHVIPVLPDVGIADRAAEQDFRKKLFEARITELMRSRLVAYRLHVPVFGDFLDVNDLWLISGVLGALLLLILAAHMDRQLANYKKAKAICRNNTCRDLLIMNQIFALPGESRTRAQRIAQRVLLVTVCWLPAVLNLIIIGFDFWDLNKGIFYLLATTRTYIEYGLRAASVAVMFYFGYLCYVTTRDIDAQVEEIHATDFGDRESAATS